MDGLIVKPPFADLIIGGNKQWELRNRPVPKSKLSSRLFLLSQGNMLGEIKITNSFGPINISELRKTTYLHNSNLKGLNYSFTTYVWEIKVLKKFSKPKKYFHPNGAQVWVKDVLPLHQYMKQKLNSYF